MNKSAYIAIVYNCRKMHTGVISFCDRVAYNIKSSDTKDDILRELEVLYKIKILQKHWHHITESNVKHIYTQPHMACLRSNGNPYYMFFTKYEDVPIIFYIDKKVQPGYQKPRIILGRGLFDESLFENGGTVLDGEMVKDTDGQWIFLINDVIVFKGTFLEDVPLPKRLVHAYTLLQSFQPDPVVDMCTFQVKQYCYASREGFDFLLEFANQLPYTNRGIYFCPYFMQHKPKLYNFDASLIKEVHRKVKDNPEFREKGDVDEVVLQEVPIPQATIPSAPCNSGEIIMWLRKTEYPDVYDVYESQSQTQTKSIGIAHVQSLSMSKKLRAKFKDLTVTMSVPFRCRYNETFKKYEPIAAS